MLEGNPGKRPLPANEPKPEAAPEASAPPAHLSAEAQAEWRRMYGPLRAAGLLTIADVSAFEMYCATLGRLRDAEKILARESATITTPNGHRQAHPALSIARGEARLLKALAAEFGLTPASRCRIMAAHTPPTGEAATASDHGEFTGLLGRRFV